MVQPNNLNSNFTSQPCVAGEINLPHPASANLFKNPVMSEGFTG
jgi:hypothetical protein